MSQSIVDKVAEAIWQSTVKRQVEWKDITNEARELWIKDAKAAIEAMLPSFNAMMEQESVAPEMRRMIINNLSK